LKIIKHLLCVAAVLIAFKTFAQKNSTSTVQHRADSVVIDSSKQRDAIDVLKNIFFRKLPDTRKKSHRLNFSIVPAIGYSLSTGFAFDVSSNVAFYTSADHKENLSEINAEGILDTRQQQILISRAEIWGNNNGYKLVTDLRLEKFPDDTYGLGTGTPTSKDDPIVFNYVRTYVTLFKKIIPDYYIGVGYNYDHHYNITSQGNADGSESDFQKYGQHAQSTSSGVNINLLYDNRRNPINPLNGGYAALEYRENPTFLGSDGNWREFQFDFRRYIKVSPATNNNILAFWVLGTFTGGNTPYLDLPATGDDMYNNSGRGYAQNRFRGKDRLYMESEYRFNITPNGLIGGVAFANAESFTEYQTNRFEKVAPAAGTGIRVKINKHSDTNICIDYAAGLYGSHGFFVNLGEVF
jgi:hypothetical protein